MGKNQIGRQIAVTAEREKEKNFGNICQYLKQRLSMK